jgi:dTDP-4-amino-4,6-dideoxygalactose transaminase
MNSYPFFYSLLSHRIFGLIKKRNPALLRKILYSGFGLNSKFNLWERPRFSNYQAGIGLAQFGRADRMNEARKEHSRILDEKLKDVKNLILPKKAGDCELNYQYYVVHAKKGADEICHKMYAKGIHLMKEDMWDCTNYAFAKEYYRACPVASSRTPGLVRVQNNSFLNRKQVIRIGEELKTIASQI